MKTTVKKMDYDQVMQLQRYPHKLPRKPNMFWRTLVRGLSGICMQGTQFKYETERMELVGKDEPCLILMNHSCFLDMEIASMVLYPRPYNIVTASDAFAGWFRLMEWALRSLGAFPTQKFVTDMGLLQDMSYCFKELKTSILMYPEASYSFDGTCTPLPRKLGVLLKKFDVPVLMIETFGAYTRCPLYNELKYRKNVPISAKLTCLYTREEIREKSVKELSDGIDAAFGFDHYKWQKEQNLHVDADDRADGLSRILYKCAHCGAEGHMEGKGIHLTCHNCGKQYELTTLGELKAVEGETEFSHIPDWYAWERQQVRQEILDGKYSLETDVDIAMLVDFKAIYMVGEGHLSHDREGFRLTGCDGRLNYTQSPKACYSLYADYYWYEIADTICIGDNERLYYCFPKGGDVVAKTRLAVEEMYKLYKSRVLPPKPKAEE